MKIKRVGIVGFCISVYYLGTKYILLPARNPGNISEEIEIWIVAPIILTLAIGLLIAGLYCLNNLLLWMCGKDQWKERDVDWKNKRKVHWTDYWKWKDHWIDAGEW